MSCRASPKATVTSIQKDGPVIFSLIPFGTKKNYKSLASGQVKHCNLDLHTYQQKTLFAYVKETINNFYRRHVSISPNKRDVVKRRHPIYPAQFEVKQAMLRYQTINELWHPFIEDHHEMEMAIQN